MISTNARTLDKDDVAVLFLAACNFGNANEETTDVSLVAAGMGDLLKACEDACTVIAKHHFAEGDNWDGCAWLEQLECTETDSLAARVFNLHSDGFRSPAVAAEAFQWMSERGLA